MQFWERFQARVTQALEEYGAMMPQFLIGLTVFVAWYFAAGFVRRGVRAAMFRVSGDDGSSRAISRLVRSVFLTLGFLVAASIAFPGFSFSALVTTLGLGSVALGFAFKDVIENFLGGLILFINRPFRIGEVIEIQGRRGVVTTIETRTTQLRMFDGEFMIMPNAILCKEPLVVVSRQPVRRFEVRVGTAFGTDYRRAIEIVERVLREIPSIQPDPAPRAFYDKIADSSVEVRALYWLDTLAHDMLEVKSEVVMRVTEALQSEGVQIPYPTRVIVNAVSVPSPGEAVD